MIADVVTEPVLDACTLNNALNVAQLVVLGWLLQRLKPNDRRD